MTSLRLTTRCTDFTIERLEDFKTIMDFYEESDTVAVISHPGWKSHRKNQEGGIRKARKYWRKLGKYYPKVNGISRTILLFLHEIGTPSNYPSTRHMILEAGLLYFLAKERIPTIVTIPTKRRSSRTTEEGFSLSDEVSQSLVDYLRDVKGERDNFYLLPTESNSGVIQSDNDNGVLDAEIPARFLESVRGRRVLYAGSNLQQCFSTTLRYLVSADCSIEILTNYVGIDKSKIKLKFLEPQMESFSFEYISTHPDEEDYRELLQKFVEKDVGKILESEGENIYPNSRITIDSRYV